MEAEDDISHCPPLTLKILQKVKFLSETLPEANHYFKADNKYLVWTENQRKSFLAVQDSSIGDIVTEWVSEVTFDFCDKTFVTL